MHTFNRTAMTQRQSAGAQFLIEYFAELNARSLRYCVTGNAQTLPEIPPNDIDIVCDNNALPAIVDLFHAHLARHGGFVAQVLRHEIGAYYYVGYLPLSGGGSAYVKLDVCTDYVVGGQLFLTADWLLHGRRQAVERQPTVPFYVASPSREFAYYLLKKISKGVADTAALQHLSGLRVADPEGCGMVLNRFWSPASADLLDSAIAAKTWTPVATRLQDLQRELRANLPRPTISMRLAEAMRVSERVAKPAGFVVAVLGPDGSGKSTLLSALLPRLEALGRRTLRFHLMPPVGRADGREGSPEVNPHGKRLRGPILSTLKLLYLVISYNVGWMRHIWLPRRRSAIVVFDRYYHDILADPRRYRNGAPAWVVRLLGRLTPAPDLFLILDASPEIVRSRKTEVTIEESARQFKSYRSLCAELPHAHLVDANLAADRVVALSEALVAKAMSARLKRAKAHVSH